MLCRDRAREVGGTPGVGEGESGTEELSSARVRVALLALMTGRGRKAL